MSGIGRPGSGGEHELQDRYGNTKRANAFYDNQVLDYLTPEMREFILRMQMAFIATSDAHGECDNSFRAGPPGFLRVIDEKTVMWPEYKGNGVMASMGNIMENPYVGILMVDFFETAVGLHVNGTATIVENDAVTAFAPLFDRLPFATPMPEVPEVKKTPERWVVVSIDEAYIHCSKHIPMLRHLEHDEVASAEAGRRAGDVFKAKNGERSWLQPAICETGTPEPEPQIGEATILEATTVESRFLTPPVRRHAPQPVRK
jgi:predicted pyridoxine 5'-phosphate oxidase superfamily flavin-nucleotide-binding protein